jgi:hypothetical protein
MELDSELMEVGANLFELGKVMSIDHEITAQYAGFENGVMVIIALQI